MYFRVKKHKNKDGEIGEYLCVIKGYRKGGRVRQKLIANLGRLDELKANGNLARLADKLCEMIGRRKWIDLAKEVKVVGSKYFGVIQVLRAIWKKLAISRILREEGEGSSKEFAFEEAVQAMVINRLVHPASKLETWKWKDRKLSQNQEVHAYQSFKFPSAQDAGIQSFHLVIILSPFRAASSFE